VCWTRRLGAFVAGAVTLVGLVAPSSASAETSGDAQRQADRVLAQVQGLQAQTQQALQRYDDALTGVAQSVTEGVLADVRVGDARQAARQAQAAFDGRVQALYKAGGPLAIYLSALDAQNVGDLLDRYQSAASVIDASQLAATRQQTQLNQAQTEADSARANATSQLATARDVESAYDQVQVLLAHQQQLLAQAQQHVADLKAAEAAAAALAAAQAAAAQAASAAASQARPSVPPSVYFQLYHAAATTCPGLSWTVLAAIGQVESGHGRNTSTSYAGAMGPMQFLPATFASYAVDGDHDGKTDIQDPADAVYTAARYLCANGAGTGPQGLYSAIWHYNHADWYVQMVLSLAGQYAAQG
jgi:peptidoglycan hydrolase CwlO-like protein